MGIRSWLYWIDRAMAGDWRPWVWLGVWVAGVAAGLLILKGLT
jgi:hypothetical protein